MEQPIYTLAATGFRYVAVFILVLIFWNIFRTSLQEARSYSNSAEGLPHIYVGILEIRDENKRLLKFGILQDCMIGRSNRCDIALKDKTMAPVHAHIYLKGNHLYIAPMSRKAVKINGQRIRSAAPIEEGDRLVLGLTRVRIRLMDSYRQEEEDHDQYQ